MANEGSFFGGFGRRREGASAPEPLWGGEGAYPRAVVTERKAQGNPATVSDPPTVSWSSDTTLAATTPTP